MRTEEYVAVADAGPIIHLDELDCLDLLSDLGALLTPDLVWNECRKHRPDLQEGHLPGLDTVPVQQEPSARVAVLVDSLGLDMGETAALVLAEQRGLHIFLTDDSAARLAGESLGLRVHGTMGILVRSIRRGLRSRAEVLDILAHIRERSTLHLAQSLLEEVAARVAAG